MKIILGICLAALMLSLAVLLAGASYLLFDEVHETWQRNQSSKRIRKKIEEWESDDKNNM